MRKRFTFFVFEDQSHLDCLTPVDLIRVLWERLCDGHAVFVNGALKLRRPCALEPAVSPLPDIDLVRRVGLLHSLIQALNEIFKLGVRVLEPLAVFLAGKAQGWPADEVVHSLDPAGSLPVGYHIKHTHSLACVLDFLADRVR